MPRQSMLMFAAVFALAAPAFGWGADGHRIIAAEGIKALPLEIPGFVRGAADEIGYLGPEADRQKGAGVMRDKAYDPGHFVDLSDDLSVLGGPKLDDLPETVEAYDTALRAVGQTQYRAGYLPYSLVAGYQLLVKDFALYRAYLAGEKIAKSAGTRAIYAKQRLRRERVLIHDLGYWTHFVGDASQPLHVTVHFNGWGDYPNPEKYTLEKVHGPWESEFVHANVTGSAVAKALPEAKVCEAPIQKCVVAYVRGTHDAVGPFYRLEKTGAFSAQKPTADGIAFTATQIARGAGELRDLVVKAWRDSASAKVGWPEVPVSDIEVGKAEPPPAFGG
jgi:hypothetical protein